MPAQPDRPAWGTAPKGRDVEDEVDVAPQPHADLDRIVARANAWELKLRQGMARLIAAGAAAWQVYDGYLLVTNRPEQMQGAVFIYAAHAVPGWPWAAGVFIAAAGAAVVYASAVSSLRVGALGMLGISFWHFVYGLLIWHTIQHPVPGKPLTAPNAITDHATISVIACLWGLMLVLIWRGAGVPRLDHVSA